VNKLEKIVFASGNAGKAREVQAVLGDEVTLVLQGDLNVESIEETGHSFRENALLKARHAALVTGLPALADDSGLAVDFLDGAPGIYSARFAGPAASDTDNVEKLLHELRDVSPDRRGARFCCELALVRDAEDPDPIVVSGCWEGSIALVPSGKEGFGYDPVFIDPEGHCTAAELDAATKNKRSHRGKALKLLRDELSKPNR